MKDFLVVVGGSVVAIGGLLVHPILGAFFGGVGGLLVHPILGAFFGGVGGWLVGIFFGDLILGTLAALGIKGLTMWQLGVTLGFLSGYQRSCNCKTSD